MKKPTTTKAAAMKGWALKRGGRLLADCAGDCTLYARKEEALEDAKWLNKKAGGVTVTQAELRELV